MAAVRQALQNIQGSDRKGEDKGKHGDESHSVAVMARQKTEEYPEDPSIAVMAISDLLAYLLNGEGEEFTKVVEDLLEEAAA